MEFNGEADHVHARVSLPTNLDLSRFVNNLKTTSSRLVRREYARQLSRVYRKPAILLRHLVRWRAAVRAVELHQFATPVLAALCGDVLQHVEHRPVDVMQRRYAVEKRAHLDGRGHVN